MANRIIIAHYCYYKSPYLWSRHRECSPLSTRNQALWKNWLLEVTFLFLAKTSFLSPPWKVCLKAALASAWQSLHLLIFHTASYKKCTIYVSQDWCYIPKKWFVCLWQIPSVFLHYYGLLEHVYSHFSGKVEKKDNYLTGTHVTSWKCSIMLGLDMVHILTNTIL